ncbi:MAG: toll/interleukin-1 receptor domain-containing protein, partial [Pseudomonadota bacterium]
MAKIFISYRRNDSGYVVDALHRALSSHVDDPKRDIFLDVDNIPFGVNFVEHLNRKVGECEVLLAVIGKDWLNASDPVSGERLISRQEDFVRVEIAAALERGVPVIPVLLDGAQVPNPSELPESIRSLSHHNGVRLTRENFKADIEKLVRGSPVALSQKDASASVQSSSVSVEDEAPAPYTAYVSSSETGRPKLDGSVDQEFYFRRSPLLWFALPVYIIIFPLLP